MGIVCSHHRVALTVIYTKSKSYSWNQYDSIFCQGKSGNEICRRIFVILTRVLDAMLSARKSSEELDENRQPVVVESTTCGC
jgi:hypothetical protein